MFPSFVSRKLRSDEIGAIFKRFTPLVELTHAQELLRTEPTYRPKKSAVSNYG
jgi:hypothetical protein